MTCTQVWVLCYVTVLVTVLQVQVLLNHRAVLVYIRNHIGGQYKCLCWPHFAPGTQIGHAGDNFLRFVNGACAGQVNPTALKRTDTGSKSSSTLNGIDYIVTFSFWFYSFENPWDFQPWIVSLSGHTIPTPNFLPPTFLFKKNKFTLLSSLTYSLLFSSSALSLLRTLHYSCGVSKLCNSCRGTTWAPSFTTQQCCWHFITQFPHYHRTRPTADAQNL